MVTLGSNWTNPKRVGLIVSGVLITEGTLRLFGSPDKFGES